MSKQRFRYGSIKAIPRIDTRVLDFVNVSFADQGEWACVASNTIKGTAQMGQYLLCCERGVSLLKDKYSRQGEKHPEFSGSRGRLRSARGVGIRYHFRPALRAKIRGSFGGHFLC